MKKIRANIFACATLGYAVAIGSAILNIVKEKNYNVIYDAVFLIVISLLIHLLQSRVAAIILGVYAVLDVAVLFYMTGKPGGGKSMLAKQEIITRFLKETKNADIIIIDPEQFRKQVR